MCVFCVQMATQAAAAAARAGDAASSAFFAASPYAHEAGVRVVRVVPFSPAAEAGLLPGDVVLSCGGAPTASARALQAAVERAVVGQPLTLRLVRGGALHAVPVITGDVATRADAAEELAAAAAAGGTLQRQGASRGARAHDNGYRQL
jgi:S1-C subfamily serine protease